MNVRIVLQLHFLTLKKHKIKIKARETTCVSLSYWWTLNKIWPKLNALTQTVHAGPLMFTEEKSYKSRCNMCNAQLLQTWPYLCPTSCCSNNLLWPSRQHHFVVLAPINVHRSLIRNVVTFWVSVSYVCPGLPFAAFPWPEKPKIISKLILLIDLHNPTKNTFFIHSRIPQNSDVSTGNLTQST